MTNIGRRFALIALLFVGIIGAVAQSQQQQAADKAQQVAREPARPESSTGNEAVLRAQLQTMKEYEQQLLTTVHWSLAGVFLLVVVVAGVNWFANYRLYERDRDALRESLRLDLQASTRQLAEDYLRAAQSMREEVKSQLSGGKETLRAEMLPIIETRLQSVRVELAGVRRQFLKEASDETKFRALYYASQKDLFHEFGAWIEHLGHMRALGYLWDAHWVGEVVRRLSHILDQKVAMSYQFQKKLFELLEKAPDGVQSEVREFLKKVESSQKIS
jgi:hypothetical protein